MKNYKSKLLQATFVFAAIIGMSSCTGNKTEDTKEVAEEKNEQKFEESKNEKDAQFLVNAAEISFEEIALGQLAQKKGSTSHVKELGKMMENEHTKSLADLKDLAKTKSVSLPTSQTETGLEAYEKLNKKSGKEFGETYSDMMVKGHQEAIALFEKAATECTDSDIKAWALATIPALKTHLEHALVCQKECKKK